jgi:ribosomal protein S18 acetylase RimI-like enzyme
MIARPSQDYDSSGKILIVRHLGTAAGTITGMSTIRVLQEHDWPSLRDVRLTALKDSPEAFLSTYERELAYSESDWRTEFSRGEWTIELSSDEVIGLLGATREPGASANECYLEYMWVSPLYRNRGVASNLIEHALRRLTASGIDTVLLWTLDVNESARRLYDRLGFLRTLHRQPLPGDPGRYEELMRRTLCDVNRLPRNP